MTTKSYTVVFDGTGADDKALPQGIYWYLMTAGTAIDISARGFNSAAAPLEMTGVPAGSRFGPLTPDKKWQNLVLHSTVAQSVTIVISDDAEFAAASAVTVVGNVTTVESRSSALASIANTSIANGASATIAANANRRKIHICNPSTPAVSQIASLWVSATNAASPRGVEVAPGVTFTLATTAQIFVRNDSGAALDYTYLEET
jgi:hypothetical protein